MFLYIFTGREKVKITEVIIYIWIGEVRKKKSGGVRNTLTFSMCSRISSGREWMDL